MFRLYKVLKDGTQDLTDYVGEISLRSSSDEISEELSFKMAYSDVNVTPNIINPGDILSLKKDGIEVWQGVVEKESTDGRSSKSYNCFDFGWYLNKNEEMYQFNDTVSNNIRKICTDFQIPVGEITNIPTIWKNTNRDNIYSIIQKMLELAEKDQGVKYICEMRSNKFYVLKRDDNPIEYFVNEFGVYSNANLLISNPSSERSIENLYNVIKVAMQEDSSVKILANSQDANSIGKYGRLQKLIYLDKDDQSKASNIATNELKNLNRIELSGNIDLVGNISCRAGRVINLNEPITGLVGKFLIEDCQHDITPTSHTMSLKVKEV